MITKVFWALVVLDGVAVAILAILASRGPRSLEGVVGGWLAVIPPVVLVLLVVLALAVRTESVKIAGIWILGVPWIGVIAGPIYSAIERYQTDRSIAGDNDFRRAPQRKLAHAIQDRDVAAVKTLIPQAGDLNKQYGNETLLSFAVFNAPDRTQSGSPVPPTSIEIVRALLDAGANADLPVAKTRWPLTAAISSGPEITELLLRAGADPNHLDDAGRPLWWDALSDDSDRGLTTLRLLLDHGADLKLRDRESGPVGWAAYHAHSIPKTDWRLVDLLVERGATWKGEQEFGQTVDSMLQQDCEERERQGKEISEEMRKLRAK